jgi:hypothetical protein
MRCITKQRRETRGDIKVGCVNQIKHHLMYLRLRNTNVFKEKQTERYPQYPAQRAWVRPFQPTPSPTPKNSDNIIYISFLIGDAKQCRDQMA